MTTMTTTLSPAFQDKPVRRYPTHQQNQLLTVTTILLLLNDLKRAVSSVHKLDRWSGYYLTIFLIYYRTLCIPDSSRTRQVVTNPIIRRYLSKL